MRSVIKRQTDSIMNITSGQTDTLSGQGKTTSGQMSSTNGQTNGKRSTRSVKTSTTCSRGRTVSDQRSFASTTSEKTGLAIIISPN